MNHNSAETAQKFLALLNTPELAALGPTVRVCRSPLSDLATDLEELFRAANLPAATQRLLRAITLFWHDYLDEAHVIAQDISTADGSVLHGMMHRREPDYGNAKYWFHRAGAHAAFAEIAREVQVFLQKTSRVDRLSPLFRSGTWSPDGFVDLCQNFGSDRLSDEYQLLQQLQWIETRVLVKQFCTTPR